MFAKWFRFIRQSVSIHSGTDVPGTIEQIRNSINIRGANVWLLGCSAMLASIGLDLNSTAVIIGAMLISPLMSPILGVGLGFAILDRSMLRTSIGNLILATFVSLFVSFLYFLVSPLGVITPEIEARTTPTILDVGVAFFGGIAGIVAGSRRDKTSAIPGVAIATALMPPVCVSGYGLASGNFSTFLGAFYLFFINAFFIALATYLMSLLLRFPKRAELDSEQDRQVKLAIIAVAVVLMLPSAFIFYGVIQKLRTDRGISNFVSTEIRKDDRVPIRWELEGTPGSGTLKVYCVGRESPIGEIYELKNAMNRYGLAGIDLQLVQMNVPRSDFDRLAETVETDVTGRFKLIASMDEKRKLDIAEISAEMAQLRLKSDPDASFIAEALERFDILKEASWQSPTTTDESVSSQPKKVLVTGFSGDADPKDIANAKRSILSAARLKFPFETVEIVDKRAPSD